MNPVPIRILLAEDHQMVRQGLRLLLETEANAAVEEADNGRDAVQMACDQEPDVVVMDLTMPDLNGVDATRQIMQKRPKIRVVAISSRTDSRAVGDALQAGARGFVPKDSAFSELIAAVRAVSQDKVYLSPRVTAAVVETYLRPSNASVASSVLGREGLGVAPSPERLTGREREVLQLVAEGLAMKEIAARLHVSVKTIETHRRQIMEKLHLYSVAELTKYAIREGLTSA